MRVSINWPEASWWQWPLLLARLLTVSGSRTRIWARTGSLHLSMSDVSLCQRCPALLIRKLLDKADSFGQSSHYSCIDIIDYQGWGWVNRIFRFLHFYYKCHLHEGENFLNFLFLWCWENGKNSLVALHLICVMHVWDVMGLNALGALSLLPDVWPLWMGHST